ncbi:MAG: hypothetical protein ACOY5F_20040 [Pseudomonadota bacterium]
MTLPWQTESLRLSVFSSEPIKLSESDWQTLTGQTESDLRQNIPGGRLYAGQAFGGQLNLSYAATRADVVLSASNSTSAPAEVTLPVFGTWTETRDVFAKAVPGWLTSTSFPIVRIAFGAVLLLETKTGEDNYRMLEGLLQSVKVDPRMRDLIFRVNWPRDSSVKSGLSINRVTHWSSLRFSLRALELTGDVLRQLSGENDKHACRLEIDHNTDAENKLPFEKSELAPIFEELVAFADENAFKGEVP